MSFYPSQFHNSLYVNSKSFRSQPSESMMLSRLSVLSVAYTLSHYGMSAYCTVLPWQKGVCNSTAEAQATHKRINKYKMGLPSVLQIPIDTSVGTTLSPYLQNIPAKIVEKILNLECINMARLIQDNWEQDEPEAHCCRRKVYDASQLPIY